MALWTMKGVFRGKKIPVYDALNGLKVEDFDRPLTEDEKIELFNRLSANQQLDVLSRGKIKKPATLARLLNSVDKRQLLKAFSQRPSQQANLFKALAKDVNNPKSLELAAELLAARRNRFFFSDKKFWETDAAQEAFRELPQTTQAQLLLHMGRNGVLRGKKLDRAQAALFNAIQKPGDRTRVLELITLGVSTPELNPDGTAKVDANGKPAMHTVEGNLELAKKLLASLDPHEIVSVLMHSAAPVARLTKEIATIEQELADLRHQVEEDRNANKQPTQETLDKIKALEEKLAQKKEGLRKIYELNDSALSGPKGEKVLEALARITDPKQLASALSAFSPQKVAELATREGICFWRLPPSSYSSIFQEAILHMPLEQQAAALNELMKIAYGAGIDPSNRTEAQKKAVEAIKNLSEKIAQKSPEEIASLLDALIALEVKAKSAPLDPNAPSYKAATELFSYLDPEKQAQTLLAMKLSPADKGHFFASGVSDEKRPAAIKELLKTPEGRKLLPEIWNHLSADQAANIISKLEPSFFERKMGMKTAALAAFESLIEGKTTPGELEGARQNQMYVFSQQSPKVQRYLFRNASFNTQVNLLNSGNADVMAQFDKLNSSKKAKILASKNIKPEIKEQLLQRIPADDLNKVLNKMKKEERYAFFTDPTMTVKNRAEVLHNLLEGGHPNRARNMFKLLEAPEQGEVLGELMKNPVQGLKQAATFLNSLSPKARARAIDEMASPKDALELFNKIEGDSINSSETNKLTVLKHLNNDAVLKEICSTLEPAQLAKSLDNRSAAHLFDKPDVLSAEQRIAILNKQESKTLGIGNKGPDLFESLSENDQKALLLSDAPFPERMKYLGMMDPKPDEDFIAEVEAKADHEYLAGAVTADQAATSAPAPATPASATSAADATAAPTVPTPDATAAPAAAAILTPAPTPAAPTPTATAAAATADATTAAPAAAAILTPAPTPAASTPTATAAAPAGPAAAVVRRLPSSPQPPESHSAMTNPLAGALQAREAAEQEAARVNQQGRPSGPAPAPG